MTNMCGVVRMPYFLPSSPELSSIQVAHHFAVSPRAWASPWNELSPWLPHSMVARTSSPTARPLLRLFPSVCCWPPGPIGHGFRFALQGHAAKGVQDCARPHQIEDQRSLIRIGRINHH